MRKALIATGVVLALLAGLALLAVHSLDFVVKVALEHFGSRLAGASLQVGAASVEPREGRARLVGVVLANPRGFSSPRAARLGSVRVALDPRTILDPVVVIHEIAIEAPEITFERGSGPTNLDVIQKSFQGHAKEGGAGRDPAALAPPARRYVIERLTIRGAKVTMTNPGLRGQGIVFALPDIELRDLGKRERGISAGEAADIVAGTLIARIAQRVLTNVEALRQGGAEGAIEALRKILK